MSAPASVIVAGEPVALDLPAGARVTVKQLDGGTPVHLQLVARRDPRARLSAGHARFSGFHLGPGHVLVSTPPPYRPLMVIDDVQPSATIDLLDPGCDDCRAASARHIASTGLTRFLDHDPVNLWLETTWDDEGFSRHPARVVPGAEIALLAIEELIALVTPCASDAGRRDDPGRPGRIEVTVGDPLAVDRRRDIETIVGPFEALATTAWPAADPGSERTPRIALDSSFVPAFQGVPLERHRIPLTLDSSMLDELRSMTGLETAPAHAVVRFALMDRISALRRSAPLLRRGPSAATPAAARDRSADRRRHG